MSANIFERRRVVGPAHIDEAHHVNNVTYLQWVQEMAVGHWQALSAASPYADAMWVVARHEIDYRRPAVEGDALLLRTWVGETSRISSIRHTSIVRESDGVEVCAARTTWVLVDKASGRPRRIEEGMLALLGAAVGLLLVLVSGRVHAQAAAPSPPPATSPAAARPRYLRASDADTLPARPATARIAYGRDSLQFGDLRLPEGNGPFPVAIVIHGGCWYSPYANLRNIASFADALARDGIASWSVEYRRYDQPGGGWPGTFLDVASAADHVRELARRYPLDLGRVLATGHSAGGHLALWLAARHRLPATSALHRPDPITLVAAVSLGGPGNLEEFTARKQPCGPEHVPALMGGSPAAEPSRYAEGSPFRLLPLGVPQWIVAGEDDGIIPPSAARDYVDAARAKGDRAEYIGVPQQAHFEVIAPERPAGREARALLARLLGVTR